MDNKSLSSAGHTSKRLTAPDNKFTTSRGNVVALSQALQAYGVDPAPILQQGNVESTAAESSHRISGFDMDRMVCMAVEATGDPAFGLKFVEFIQPNSYHALGVALLYSASLRSFCQRLARYFTIITNMDEIYFEESDEFCYLAIRPRFKYSEVADRVNSDAWAGYIVRTMRQIVGPAFQPLRVELVWSPSDVLMPKYDDLFRCPIEVSAQEGRVYLDAAVLDTPLPSSNAELARQNDKVVADYLAGMDRQNLPSLVHMKMIELLPSGLCDRKHIAHSLNLTVRTMHNRLERDGVSYKVLLEKTRQELAQEYLETGSYSVSDIAYLLGYADIGNFSRAFKRWTGHSPRNYQKVHS
ncbi:MAG: AraC family transcriptional regulator [Halioglobus sp.]